jgi:hypothetical protein
VRTAWYNGLYLTSNPFTKESTVIDIESFMPATRKITSHFLSCRNIPSIIRDDAHGESLLILTEAAQRHRGTEDDFPTILRTALRRRLAKWACKQIFERSGFTVPENIQRIIVDIYPDDFPPKDYFPNTMKENTYAAIKETYRIIQKGFPPSMTPAIARKTAIDRRTGRMVDDPSMWVDAADEGLLPPNPDWEEKVLDNDLFAV